MAVLRSKGAKIFGWIGWSEIGFFYFSGGLIYLFVSLIGMQGSLEALRAINLIALPYVFYSVFYQWRVMKVWCPLCLIVQGLLFFEFLHFLIVHGGPFTVPSLSTISIISAVISFYIPVLFWVFSKKLIVKAREGQILKKEFFKLKHNTEIFNNVLTQQKKVTLPSEDLGIIIGRSDSTNNLLMISNPACIACQFAHKSVTELLKTQKDLRVHVLFTSNDKGDSVGNEFVSHIMALNEIDKDQALLALDEWYSSGTKEIKAIENKFPLKNKFQYDTSKIREMDRWCREARISATPSFFVRGYQLPPFYNIADLSYLLS